MPIGWRWITSSEISRIEGAVKNLDASMLAVAADWLRHLGVNPL